LHECILYNQIGKGYIYQNTTEKSGGCLTRYPKRK
jgi:hypothetical protein